MIGFTTNPNIIYIWKCLAHQKMLRRIIPITLMNYLEWKNGVKSAALIVSITHFKCFWSILCRIIPVVQYQQVPYQMKIMSVLNLLVWSYIHNIFWSSRHFHIYIWIGCAADQILNVQSSTIVVGSIECEHDKD